MMDMLEAIAAVEAGRAQRICVPTMALRPICRKVYMSAIAIWQIVRRFWPYAVRDDLINYETARGIINKSNGYEE